MKIPHKRPIRKPTKNINSKPSTERPSERTNRPSARLCVTGCECVAHTNIIIIIIMRYRCTSSSSSSSVFVFHFIFYRRRQRRKKPILMHKMRQCVDGIEIQNGRSTATAMIRVCERRCRAMLKKNEERTTLSHTHTQTKQSQMKIK